jgi:hypothetical protein
VANPAEKKTKNGPTVPKNTTPNYNYSNEFSSDRRKKYMHTFFKTLKTKKRGKKTFWTGAVLTIFRSCATGGGRKGHPGTAEVA